MKCFKCGAENRAGARFCDACGIALVETSSESAPSATGAVDVRVNLQGVAPELPEGERKMVTALFADIKSSTELMRDLDPEEARAIIDPALKLMIDSVHHYDGYVVQSTGDGIFALFGAPLAHEDHSQRALHAALRIQKALQQNAEQSSRLRKK
jgi:class 3 adenylate cyclase